MRESLSLLAHFFVSRPREITRCRFPGAYHRLQDAVQPRPGEMDRDDVCHLHLCCEQRNLSQADDDIDTFPAK